VILLRGIEPHPDRLLQLFCITSDLVDFILANTPQFAIQKKIVGRHRNLKIAEAITISLYRYTLPHTTFKHFYAFMRNYHGAEFPNLPHYSNMLLLQKHLFPFVSRMSGILIGINRSAFKNKKVRLMFIDGSDLPVCTNKRIFTHKVAKEAAARGKSSKGWFYGFRIHILCDDGGNLLGVKITPGNVDERTQVKKLVGDITDTTLVGDTGYLKKTLGEELYKSNNVWFLTGVKKVMKKLMTKENHTLLKARQLVETVIGSLKFRGGMPNSLPRSIKGYQVHFVMTLLAFTIFGSMQALPLLPG
jgi:hypothetical protein